MRLSDWVQIRTVSLLKVLGVATLLVIFPLFTALVICSEVSTVKASIDSNRNALVIALQTGDLFAIDRAISSYKLNPSISMFDLYDQDGQIVRSIREPKGFFPIKFGKNLTDKNDKRWGRISVSLVPPWSILGLFFLGSLLLVIVLIGLVSNSWQRFSNELVTSIADFNTVEKNAAIPDFINGIDDLRDIFLKLKAARDRELSEVLVDMSQRVVHDIRSPLSAISMTVGTSDIDPDRMQLFKIAMKRIETICSTLLSEGKKQREQFDRPRPELGGDWRGIARIGSNLIFAKRPVGQAQVV